MNQQQSEAVKTATYLTVRQFCNENPAFREGGVRSLIFNEHENGLAKAEAIVRLGRKVLIHVPRWFAWVESQNKGGAK
ncbi:MAG TPA: hypothetical protein DCZ48_13930 [Methylococcaceae bacterium]|nr:hypothetical protein [Methylococcaceae bacterium]